MMFSLFFYKSNNMSVRLVILLSNTSYRRGPSVLSHADMEISKAIRAASIRPLVLPIRLIVNQLYKRQNTR